MNAHCTLAALAVTAGMVSATDWTAGTETNSMPLNTSGCYAPIAQGSWGFCGPDSCRDNYDTCDTGPQTVDGVSGSWATSEDDCKPFLDNDVAEDDITDWGSELKPCDDTCTQSTGGVCSSEFLTGVLKGSGVKYAYCNSDYLFIYSDGAPTIWSANLNDVPYPPGNGDSTARTGLASVDFNRGSELYYPLEIELLPTDSSTNNVDVWDAVTYLEGILWDDDHDNVGIPADSGVGMSVSGQVLYPIWNNVAVYTPQQCEVDSCNEHVGQGGGQPHLHGDPFGDEAPTKCLYGPSNYTGDQYGETGHPPLMGFGADGILVYGRYLYDTQLGYQEPMLDNCGGHQHTTSATSAQDPYGLVDEYHYHAQIFDAYADSSAVADEGDFFTASTTGPYNCYRANLTASKGSMALYEAADSLSEGKGAMSNRCCDMTDYYILTGLAFPDSGSNKISVDDSSTCSSPSPPDNGYFTANTVCEAVGTTMYSGWSCNVTCDDGYVQSGTTQCVGGVLSEATCEVDATEAPSAAPTAAVADATEAPSAAPTAAVCEDDSSWSYKGKSGKDCAWLSKKPHKYCGRDDGNDWLGLDACAASCLTCDCSDDDSWYRAGKPSKDCDYVANKPSKYCDYEGEDGTYAYESCPKACGECGCQDSATWTNKGKSSKDCDWVSKDPDGRCKKKSSDGVKAKEACLVACEKCD